MSNSSHRLERAYQAGLAAVWEQLVRLDRELEGMTNERSLAARARIRREIETMERMAGHNSTGHRGQLKLPIRCDPSQTIQPRPRQRKISRRLSA
jgi:hypothetical protein